MSDVKKKHDLASDASNESASGYFPALCFLLILGLGIVLRSFNLGRAFLWIDEITVLMFARPVRSAWEIIRSIYEARFTGFTGQHMPFQYAWLNLFLQLRDWTGSPQDTWWVRLPFVMLGAGALPFIYWASARLYGVKTGLWCMFLASISFFHVYISRDATSYAPLIFFLSMNFAGLVSLVDEKESARFRYAAGFVFVLGTFGALFSHATAWFILGTQGIMLVSAQAVASRKPAGVKGWFKRFARGRYALAVILLIIGTLPVLSLMLAGRETFFASERAVGVEPDPVTLPLIVYQLSMFGWGRSAGRLALFVLAVSGGIFAVLKNRDSRGAGVCQLALVLIPASLFLSVLSRNFAPRYLSIVFIPLICFAGIGMASFIELIRRTRFRSGVPFASGAIILVLLLYHIGPYRTLFAMTDKIHAVAPVYEWILENVPVRGLYVMRNSYYMRDVPQTYHVGDRYTFVSDYPQHNMPPEIYRRRSQNVRSFFQRFPLAVLIVEPDTEYEPVHWQWIHTDFERSEVCSVYDDHYALWKYGFWQNGHEKPRPFDFHIKYNTESDVVARAKMEERETAIIPVFGGWGFFQTQDGLLFTSPLDPSILRIYNLTENKARYRLEIQGAAAERGVLYMNGKDDEAPRHRLPFDRSERLKLDAGLLTLKPGLNELVLNVVSVRNPALLIYAFDLMPETDPA